jgi:hypothetical protein
MSTMPHPSLDPNPPLQRSARRASSGAQIPSVEQVTYAQPINPRKRAHLTHPDVKIEPPLDAASDTMLVEGSADRSLKQIRRRAPRATAASKGMLVKSEAMGMEAVVLGPATPSDNTRRHVPPTLGLEYPPQFHLANDAITRPIASTGRFKTDHSGLYQQHLPPTSFELPAIASLSNSETERARDDPSIQSLRGVSISGDEYRPLGRPIHTPDDPQP